VKLLKPRFAGTAVGCVVGQDWFDLATGDGHAATLAELFNLMAPTSFA
jgi:hypothetical protein